MRLLRSLVIATVTAAPLVVSGACGSKGDQHTFATPLVGASSSAGGAQAASATTSLDIASTTSGPPPVDAGGLCGNDFHQIIADTPNVYFVLDISGSMTDPSVPNDFGSPSKYEVLKKATIGVVKQLGDLINVGAALFPVDADEDNQCHIGGEVMSVRPGDPNDGTIGPTTTKLELDLNVEPYGGTPTAATLNALAPEIEALPGRTIVVLATDGGPNCNGALSCDASTCEPNIEMAAGCDPSVNCCDGSLWGPESCLDDAATVAAISAIAKHGIQVYVVGIPGSDAYVTALGKMAIAGGAAQLVPPYYYKVDDISTLQATLGSIASFAVSCDFTLANPPTKKGDTNVYLNGEVLPADPTNGWVWNGSSEVDLVGAACQKLKDGQVQTVQIVTGCPTVGPK